MEENAVTEIRPYIWDKQTIIDIFLRDALEASSHKRQSLRNGKKKDYMNNEGGEKKIQNTLKASSPKRQSWRTRQKKNNIKNGGRRKKSRPRGRQAVIIVPVPGNCNNLNCLNNMLVLQKMDKDTAQNYIQSTYRTQARIRLGGLYTRTAFRCSNISKSEDVTQQDSTRHRPSTFPQQS